MAEVPWARPMSRMTRQMEALLMSQCKRSSVRGVALEYDVSDYRIWHALKHYVDKARKKADHFGVRTVGIDETSTCKGHHYITVVVDAKTGRVQTRGSLPSIKILLRSNISNMAWIFSSVLIETRLLTPRLIIRRCFEA